MANITPVMQTTSGVNSPAKISDVIYLPCETRLRAGLVLPKTVGVGVKVDPDDPTYAWRDLHGILRPDDNGVNAPVLAAVRGGSCREYFYAANDKLDKDYHIPHDYAPGTDIYVHLHWGHNGTAISGNFVVTFTHTYAKGHNQEVYPAEKAVVITYATVDIATTPRWIHRIDEVQLSSVGGSGTLMDTNLLEPDGVIMMNMTVTTIPTITGSATQNKPYIHYSDVHYQSMERGTKNKSPNFNA